jgi:hypothetical protein
MNNMFNSQSKYLDRFFRKVDGLVWDLTTGKLGIQSPSGIVTLDINPAVAASGDTPAVAASYNVSINPFDGFGISIPAFASNTPQEAINVSDLIVGAKGILGWVVEKKAASLVILKQDGQQTTYVPPKVSVFGQDGSLVVKSLTNLLGNGASGFQSAMMPLMIMGEGSGLDMDKLLPLMLYQQSAAAGTEGANPLTSMLPMLMMMSALKGGSTSVSNVGAGVPPLRRTN